MSYMPKKKAKNCTKIFCKHCTVPDFETDGGFTSWVITTTRSADWKGGIGPHP